MRSIATLGTIGLLFLGLSVSCSSPTASSGSSATSSMALATNGSQTVTDATYVDPTTNKVYQLNPNRSQVLPAGSAVSRSINVSGGSDWSGQVQTSTWVSITNPSEDPSAVCTVDPGFVCIGGGAYADYFPGYGALLTETRPLSDLTGWVASSKDQLVPDTHTLYVYAIGIRLIGNNGQIIPASTLSSLMLVQNSLSAVSERPSATATLPAGYQLLGGGAQINFGSGQGNLLTKSVPTNASPASWTVQSKDLGLADACTITAFVIGIQTQSIPNFGTLFTGLPQGQVVSTPTGAHSAALAADAGFVLACPGAVSTFNGFGRMLSSLVPDGSTAMTTTSKDQGTADTGTLQPFLVEVEKAH